MKQATNNVHVLTRNDQTVEFTPMGDGMVHIYYSSMGDDNLKRTEQAREIYRDLVANGWSA